MRVGLIALVLVGVATAASAQSRAHDDTRDVPRPSLGLPLPHIGLPLPSMGLPLPQTGLPEEGFKPLERSEQLQRPERFDRSDRPRSVILFGPVYGWPYAYGLPVAYGSPYLAGTPFPSLPSPVPQPKPPTGRLHLNLQSGIDPQIFVDGYYSGLFSDVAGELTLDVGAHSIELREEGFQNLRVDVRIPLYDVISYDVDLKRIEVGPLPPVEPVVQPPQVVPPPTTIYVIPGCYIGNVPPKDAGLPAGCDPGRAVAFPSR